MQNTNIFLCFYFPEANDYVPNSLEASDSPDPLIVKMSSRLSSLISTMYACTTSTKDTKQ